MRQKQQFGRQMKMKSGMMGGMMPDVSKHPVSHKFTPKKEKPEICEICGMRMNSHKME